MQGNGNRPKRLPKVLSRQEIARLYAQINTGCPTGCRNRALLGMMAEAGLRNGEVRHLRRHDIKWNERFVEIRRGKGGKDRVAVSYTHLTLPTN